MSWIKQVPVEAAMGQLKRVSEEAIARAGRVEHTVHAVSISAGGRSQRMGWQPDPHS